jgi:hypothetical protein
MKTSETNLIDVHTHFFARTSVNNRGYELDTSHSGKRRQLMPSEIV